MRVCDMKYEDKPKLEDCKASVRSVSPQSYSNLVIPEYKQEWHQLRYRRSELKCVSQYLEALPRTASKAVSHEEPDE